MGLLILIVPIIIYFFVLKRVLKNYDETAKRLKKRTLFIILFTLPFWDHMIGYSVYKYLCYTDSGVKIDKTVTDEQEQRDYWFYDGLNVFDNSYKGKEFDYFADNKLIKRGICTKLLKGGRIGSRVCAKGGIKEVFLNYCNDKYNNLSKSDLNYKASCTNANEIIKKYKLNNVIKVPISNYYLDRKVGKSLIPFIHYIVKDEEMIISKKTNEILGKSTRYQFLGGLFINLISFPLYPQFRIECPENGFYGIASKVIPNPYNKQEE